MNSRTESVSYKNQIAKSNTTARPTQRSFGNFRVWLTRHHRLALSALSVFSVLLLWFLITALHLVPALFLPSPQAVWQKFLEVSQQGFMKATLWQHLAASISRVLFALLAAIAIGVPVGLWMGLNKYARAVLDPLVELLRPIPPLAYLPLLVIWFGIGETTKILLIFFSILAPVIISSTHGVISHQLNRERAALSLGATQAQVFWKVILPTALPHILTGIRIGLGVGWSTLVAAELVAADRGIGFMVQSAAQFLITDTVILGIIVIAVVAVSFELFLRWLQQQLSPWYGQQL
ncbi:taurine ABC transporter permease TauC [Acinetobacter ursingii]|uniref:taurine ABC transporter permease TauC n=1 Tax=Acinetobacter TaxID=469 RepID=UPI000CF1E8D8|nr:MULTISPECIES: taurine ABC transporter permease TauC [Acinetobacter]NOZ97825.1 taurine ABC transporter permease TauC [Gammaproteobacteria bacterium]MCU4489548.1 taurine ABC transporter permease TauC [Acinetobacter ursingii]MCU4497844.1 taurine ABC transporter permease TauC [Acinetobacter ursingii]MDA3580699.1 taurine ABC transporter permease TauC [Acinetobacter ursingii]MDG9860935.1 taurine ABC transporter permease TauC [Acinetobacter ursingii]